MWDKVFDQMLRRMIRRGRLGITYPDGHGAVYGPGGADDVQITIKDKATLRALCLRPELALGEAYMDARLTVEDDDLEGLLRLLIRNRGSDAFPLWVRALNAARFKLRNFLQRNTPEGARRNVAHHYDLSNDLYRSFLDEDMQYSCAYFRDPEMTLEAAQEAKKAHIAAKLRIEPGMRVLDIGCGWGGMAMALARDHGAEVVGVTLSENQLSLARERVARAGLDKRVSFRLADYRSLDERFDRVVSVGMLEHVGVPQYPVYFDKLADLLDPAGVALIHTIGRIDRPRAQSEWINKYIFPGGYVPALSDLAPAIEGSGLWQLDLEVWRLHYAMTLRHWRSRFESNLAQLGRHHDARFIRMWRYYLTACILSFEEQRQAVFQFQLGHRRDAVPLTRDYLYRARGSRGRERTAAE